MKNDDQINREIEATLDSLDGINRAGVSPYFYTRLQAKLEARKPEGFGILSQLINRPAIAVSILTVFLVLNIIAIKGITAGSVTTETKSASLQSLAIEYNLNTTSVYNNLGK
jgi:hypothetical protein